MALPATYKNAFKCNACPQSNGENGCPSWWELVGEDMGKQPVLKKGCGHALLPELLLHVIVASNRPAAAVESMRNEMAKDMVGLITVLGFHPPVVRTVGGRAIDGNAPLQLEGSENETL